VEGVFWGRGGVCVGRGGQAWGGGLKKKRDCQGHFTPCPELKIGEGSLLAEKWKIERPKEFPTLLTGSRMKGKCG